MSETDNQKKSALDLLLGDYPRKKFFSEGWEQKTVHIAHNDPDRFKHLITSERFIAEEALHCRNLRALYKNARGWSVEMNITGEQVKDIHRAGHSICATMLREEGSVGEFLDSVREEIYSAAGPHMNIYYSPENTGAGLHFDTHPVWLIQIEGKKDWIAGRTPAVKDPMFNINYPPDMEVLHLPWIRIERPDTSDQELFMELTLNPGDVLYMPPGTWHRARAREGHSFAATLAQARVTGADLVLACLLQKIPTIPAMAARMHGMCASEKGDAGELTDNLEEQIKQHAQTMKEIVNNITEADLRAIYRQLSAVKSSQAQMVTPADAAKIMKQMTL